ncbi:hypothetical protein J6590_036656 [Homalodisca vitripennis]|nr:hypothetical protein J6590_036656 [Homalodisca vitripennis]
MFVVEDHESKKWTALRERSEATIRAVVGGVFVWQNITSARPLLMSMTKMDERGGKGAVSGPDAAARRKLGN